MKNCLAIISCTFLFVLNVAHCAAQWSSVYQDANAYFYDAAFPTDDNGYVAASDTGGAMVLRTNDGGITWNKRYIAGWNFISKIAMIDNLKGYIIKGGVPVKILRTLDGFNTYAIHNLDSSFTVQSLELLNDSTGFYLNNGSRLRKFENYGASYFHVIDTLTAGQTLCFPDANTGYLDTGNGLLKTTDAGSTWNLSNNNLGFYCETFDFADSLNGYFTDRSTIYKTTNGGASFVQQINFPGVYSFAVNGTTCMASNDTGNVAFTINNGTTWHTETTGINFLAAEPYMVYTTPGGYYFLFSQFCGEIRKRQTFASGISPVSERHTLEVYPNPFSSFTTISFAENHTNSVIHISDIAGKEIRIFHFSGKQFVFDRGALEKGIYFISVYNERGMHPSKLIVE